MKGKPTNSSAPYVCATSTTFWYLIAAKTTFVIFAYMICKSKKRRIRSLKLFVFLGVSILTATKTTPSQNSKYQTSIPKQNLKNTQIHKQAKYFQQFQRLKFKILRIIKVTFLVITKCFLKYIKSNNHPNYSYKALL